MRKWPQEREENTGKEETQQGVEIELQEIVTTMDPAVSRWSIVSTCVGGGGPPVFWLHGLL